MRRPVAFLGPSLSAERARAIVPDAVIRGPARRGELDQLSAEVVDEVFLIDGVMVYEHPPSPTETYRLVERGIRVVGAGSLGALRAAELRNHGVEGVGWVFEQYRDGLLCADDEVVARLDPRTGRAETIFMVNLRYAVCQLTSTGVLKPGAFDRFLCLLSMTHIEGRTIGEMLRLGAQEPISEEVLRQMLRPCYNIKSIDAERALSTSRHAAAIVSAGVVAP